MNLRADHTFAEDEGWHLASERYAEFLRRHQNVNVLFLEAAVGFNTPAIIKYCFWRMTHEWKDAVYVCLNDGERRQPVRRGRREVQSAEKDRAGRERKSGKMKRILMIEDDGAIVYSLSALLAEEGFEVETAETLREALRAELSGFCLALLDLSLPDGEGWAFLERISQKSAPPVIILTAREDEADIVRGLDMGADDYVTKPFRAGVLLSRIRAVLRRQQPERQPGDILVCGDIRLDRRRTGVSAGGREISLTAGEFRLLAYLMENKNRTLTRNALLARFWDDGGEYVNDNTLTVTVKRLREKLGERSRKMIKTVRGIGYQMEEWDD